MIQVFAIVHADCRGRNKGATAIFVRDSSAINVNDVLSMAPVNLYHSTIELMASL